MIQPLCDGTIQSETDCDTLDKDVATQFDFDIKVMTGKGIQLEDDAGRLVNVDTEALFGGSRDLALFIMTLSVDD